MPRIRTFKPEFFRSPDTAKASHAARILFMAMWSWADDFGVGETNLYGLLGFAFPDEDEMTVKDLQRLLAEVRGSYSVRFYKHRGRFFYAVPSWDSHQKTERRANAKNPGPDDPNSSPDLRFESAEEFPRKSAAAQGASVSGTGEQGNIGTGESAVEPRANLTLVSPTEPPPIRCKKHINEPTPPNCPACGDARRFHAEWKANQDRAERARREALQAAIAACRLCDAKGMREVGEEEATRCNHDQEAVS